MDDRRRRHVEIAFALILLLYVLYAAAVIARTSFVVDGVRHFCLFDDAMISMRYARNLAEGFGPVWNPDGPRVEGYTNPLWTGYMALLHLLPVSPPKLSLLVQITAAVLLVCNLLVVRRIAAAISGNSAPAWIGAVVLTAFYLPLNNWALQGMEVAPATLIVSLAVWLAIRGMADHKFRPSLYLVLGLGLLVRMDLLVPALVICGFLMAFDRQNRRRHLIAALTALATGLAAPTGLRVLYYGDPLPNTYYLKMTGYPALLRISRGGLVLWDFVRQMNWILFLLPLALVFRRRNKAVLLLAVFGGQLAYSVYVGGDAWEWWGGANRYVSVAMPLFFVLFGCAVDAIGRLAVEKLAAAGRGQSHFRGEGAFSKKQDRPAAKIGTVPRERLPAGRSPLRHSYVAALLVTVGMLQFNALRGPQSLRRWVLIEPPLHAADNRQMVRRALLLRQVTRPDARIALAWAGIIPYFADRQMIDISGKNDRTIARLAAHRASDGPGFDHFHPGHLKWDYAHSIGKLRPDVVLQADYPPGEAEEFLAGKYETATIDALTFHFRRQSPRVLWDRLSALVKRPASLQSYTGL